MRKLVLLLLALAVLGLAGCPASKKAADANSTSGTDTAAQQKAATPPPPTEAALGEAELVARGNELFHGTEYSNTGLTCANCHADAAAAETDRKYIAHTGYGAATRGAWKITTQEQLDAKKGYAATLADAANACIGAPYMNHKDKLLMPEDARAMEAYLKSISDASAWDAAAFIIKRTDKLPVAGLKADKANGQQIFEHSCKHCHDGSIKGLDKLDGAKDWLKPIQVMAKIRKLNNWYDGYEGKSYSSLNDMRLLALLDSLGVRSASAEEPENPCANPVGDNPCGGSNPCGEAGEAKKGEHEGEEDEDIFPEGAMPFYGTDILSDQEVVDVATYVAEDL